MSRKCFVPHCLNESGNNPDKIFIKVPFKSEVRRAWYEAVGLPVRNIPNAHRYCCEDHFNLSEDVQNWMYYKTVGERIRLKQGVVPHINLEPGVAPLTETSQMSPEAKRRKIAIKESMRFGESSREAFFEEKENQPEIPEEINLAPSTSAQGTSMSSSTEQSSALLSSSTVSQHLSEDVRSYRPSSSSSDSSTKGKQKNMISSEEHMAHLEMYSRFYLGLPKETYCVVNLLVQKAPIRARDVLITLKKVRLNDAFFRLGLDFNLSRQHTGVIFQKSVPIMAHLLRQLIRFPSIDVIERQLPLHFRAKYHKVVALVDSFEIEIEKPTVPSAQALTWSTYYQCNTLKYLIATTPNGVITFLSRGFGGRTSDKLLFERSKFLDALPDNTWIMADRGFKHVADMLAHKDCVLIRPPSVEHDRPLSKHEVKEGREIASLRVHVERVIGRIREFKMLLPHSCVDNHLMYLMNYIVLIVGGIINLHDKLIK